jgi:hypothetical protein
MNSGHGSTAAVDVEGGWYHVINRGLEKRQIFPNERTNLHFLELLSVRKKARFVTCDLEFPSLLTPVIGE